MQIPTAFVSTASATATAALPSFVNACAQAAPLVSMVLLTAPLPTIKSVERSQSVGDLPLLPYSSMAANCALWTAYGFLRKETAILGPNLLGLVFSLYYMSSFLKFAPTQAPTLPGSVQHHKLAVALTLGAALLSGLLQLRPDIIGLAAVCCCIAMFGSPLSSLRTVVQTKSAASIPLPFTIASVANCFLWSVTGALKLKDFNVILPNFMGLVFGLAQVFLKVVYREKQNHPGSSFSHATP